MDTANTSVPTLSVILPVYNCEKYVAQAIDSILNQTFSDFELLIADDGSKDQSKKIIDTYALKDSRIIVSHNECNHGKVATVNRMFEQCRGVYVTIHDADDWSELNRFKVQLDKLMNSDFVLCGCNFKSISGSLIFLNNNEFKSSNTSSFHGPTIIFKRNIVSLIGGLYRYKFIVAEDTDFIKRVQEKYKTIYVEDILYNYRWLSNSLTKNVNLYTPERYAIYDLLDFLKSERANAGKDSIMTGNLKVVDCFYLHAINNWKGKVDQIYLDGINRSLYFKLYKNAFLLSLKLIRSNIFRLSGYKAIVFVVYKCLSK